MEYIALFEKGGIVKWSRCSINDKRSHYLEIIQIVINQKIISSSTTVGLYQEQEEQDQGQGQGITTCWRSIRDGSLWCICVYVEAAFRKSNLPQFLDAILGAWLTYNSEPSKQIDKDKQDKKQENKTEEKNKFEDCYQKLLTCIEEQNITKIEITTKEKKEKKRPAMRTFDQTEKGKRLLCEKEAKMGKSNISKEKKQEPDLSKCKFFLVFFVIICVFVEYMDYMLKCELFIDENPKELNKVIEVESVVLEEMAAVVNKPIHKVSNIQNEGIVNILVRSLGRITHQTISAEDIKSTITNFSSLLMEKNVSSEVAFKLCESVSSRLIGTTKGTFTTMSNTVRKVLEQTLLELINSHPPRDLLHELLSRSSKKSSSISLSSSSSTSSKSNSSSSSSRFKPYTIVFVGVNGVGKSTSLSKIAAYLLSQGQRVALCACDTFRAGAVEQLQSHANRLKVPLYQRGYKQDPCRVALEGIKTATDDDIDVLLIDTAGRMQGNNNLMKALVNLVDCVNPDLVLFVGEALVGNDGVDQLLKFNQALLTSTSKKTSIIDGIFLSKYDTVDNRVGAAISMVYATNIPLMFVGVGQTCKFFLFAFCFNINVFFISFFFIDQDLRKVNPKTLVDALFC